jgi:hypothetical protein
MTKQVKHASTTLLELAHDKTLRGVITYNDLLQALGKQAFGIALLFFALPSILPFSSIPGISFIFSVPIALFALQIMLGRKTLWLPHVLAKRTIHKDTIVKMIHAIHPFLIKIEYLLKPRWPAMTSRLMEIINGLVIFCLAVLLMLPIPLSNFIFAALLIVFSLGLIEKDGIFLVIGYVGTFIYFGFIYALIAAIIVNFL